MNTMSSFTRRALGSRASMVETTTGGEKDKKKRRTSRERKRTREHRKLSSSSSYYSQSHASSLCTFPRRGKEVCRKILHNKCTSIFMTLATIWALFGDDVRVLAFPMECDEIFVGVAIALIVLFALETTMSCFAKGKKYVFGFYFWVGRRRVFVSVYGRARVHGIRRHGSVRGNGFVRHRLKAKRTTRDTGRNRRILVISPEQVEHRERGREQEDSRSRRSIDSSRKVVLFFATEEKRKRAKGATGFNRRSSMISSSSSISSSIHNQDIREEMLQVKNHRTI